MATPPALDANCAALLLRASRSASHHGALAAARTLGSAGVPVYAALDDRFTPLTASRYLTRLFRWPRWPATGDDFTRGALMLREIIDRPTMILPLDDLSAVMVAETAARLRGPFLLPIVAPELPRALSNKRVLQSLCNAHGIATAASAAPRTMDDVLSFADRSTFPVMLKASEQWLPIGGQCNARQVHSRAELIDLYAGLPPAEIQQTLLQEYIPGDDWICHGYCNAANNFALTFTGRKLRGYPVEAGSTAVGLSVANDTLAREAERFLGSVGYSGIIDMDWRQDSRDGAFRLIDCNPRIGQNFRMFETAAGIDVVRAQHLDLTGRLIPRAAMIADRVFTVESYSLLAAVRRLGRRSATALLDLPKPCSRERAWWSPRDPVPFFVMGLRLPLQVARAAWQRVLAPSP
jgi:D-aspartate ligase